MLRLPPSLLETLGWTLIHSLWQGAIIAALLFFGLLFVKKSQVRYVFACVALLLMILVPAATFVVFYDQDVPSAETNVITEAPPSNEAVAVGESLDVEPSQTFPRVSQQEALPTQTLVNALSWRQRLATYLPYVVAIWVVGVVVLSLRLLLQWLYAERFKRRHTKTASAALQQLLRVLALRLRVSRPVQLLESSLVDAPTVIGFLKPVILLPTSALTGLTMQQLEALLAHELAHIRRHDYLINILQSVVETLLFYHPAVWWVSSCVRVEREHCCDDVAVGVSGSVVVYARALATLEHLRSQPHFALAANSGKLLNRIKRVLGKPERSTNWVVCVLIMVMLSAFLLVANMPEVQAQPEVSESYRKQIWVSLIGPEFEIPKDFPKVVELRPDNKVVFEVREGDDVKRLSIIHPENTTVTYYDYTLNGEVTEVTGEIMTEFVGTWETIKSWQSKIVNNEFTPGLFVQWMQTADSPSIGADSFMFDAFGKTGDGSAFISYLTSSTGDMAFRKLSDIDLTGDLDESGQPTILGKYIDSTTFSALGHIIQATHSLKHNLISASDVETAFVSPYVEDLLENVPLTTEDMNALFLLIEAVKSPETKKELLLKYLDEVSSVSDVGLESNETFTMPFDNPQIYSEFGRMGSNVLLRASSSEAPVKAIQDGVVLGASRLSWNDGYMVAIEHPNGFESLYKNLQFQDLPEEGQVVKQGEVIGYLSGGSILPKDVLGLYIRNAEGRYIDPLEVLPVQDIESKTEVWGVDPADIVTDSRGSLALDVGDKYYLWATIKGIVKLNDDYTDLQSTQTRDSYLQLEERHGTNRKSIIVRKYGANPVEYLYEVNGQQQPFNDEAKKWYAYAFKYAITMPVQDYESTLPPLEKVAGRSHLSSSYSESNSLIFVSVSDYADLIGPTFTNNDGSVEVRNFNPEDTLTVINTAIHYAAHDLLADTPDAHDEKVKVFIRDMIENVNLQTVAFYRLLLLINEMQTKEAKAEIVNEILPLLRDQSLIEQYQQFSEWVLESNRVYEHPYLTPSITTEPLNSFETTIEINTDETSRAVENLSQDQNAREIPFTFDPEELGITELLEQAYNIRIVVQDEQGERELLRRKVPAAQPTEAVFKIYGEATAQLFINNVLFMAWNP